MNTHDISEIEIINRKIVQLERLVEAGRKKRAAAEFSAQNRRNLDALIKAIHSAISTGEAALRDTLAKGESHSRGEGPAALRISRFQTEASGEGLPQTKIA